MKTSHTIHDKIRLIMEWCIEAYLHHGQKLNFPQNTDPTKTYQWRYLVAINNKFNEWNFDDETAKRFIQTAAAYAKEMGVIQKGLAVLHQANMMIVCYNKLQGESSSNHQTLESLKFTRKWLLAKIGDGNPLKTLLQRPNGEFANVTMWYQASKLNPLFLALSRSCSYALNLLSGDERELLPKKTELYLVKSNFLKDQTNLENVRRIFVDDWREPVPFR